MPKGEGIYISPKTKNIGLKIRLLDVLCILIPLITIPVSYTHLDVYKRQLVAPPFTQIDKVKRINIAWPGKNLIVPGTALYFNRPKHQTTLTDFNQRSGILSINYFHGERLSKDVYKRQKYVILLALYGRRKKTPTGAFIKGL